MVRTPEACRLGGWRYRYEYQGAEKTLSLGVYPYVSLSEARDRRDAARRQLAAGVNPSAQRKTEKAAQD